MEHEYIVRRSSNSSTYRGVARSCHIAPILWCTYGRERERGGCCESTKNESRNGVDLFASYSMKIPSLLRVLGSFPSMKKKNKKNWSAVVKETKKGDDDVIRRK